MHITAVQKQMEEGLRIPLGIQKKNNKLSAYCRNDDVWVKLVKTFPTSDFNVQKKRNKCPNTVHCDDEAQRKIGRYDAKRSGRK